MKLLLALLLVFTVSCCGKSLKDPRRFQTTNPAFNSYATLFETEHFNYTNNNIDVGGITINFGVTSEPNAVGTCFNYGDYREIIIDKTYWEDSNDTVKEILIFHELGHCVLDKDHTNDDDSIMSISLMNHNYYRINRDSVLSEFFL